MKRFYLLLITLILIPAGFGLETEHIASYEAERDILDFQSSGESHFVTTESSIRDFHVQKLSSNSSWSREIISEAVRDPELTEDYFVVGTSGSRSRIIVFDHEGDIHFEELAGLRKWPEDVSVFERDNQTFFTVSIDDRSWLDRNKLTKYNEEGDKLFEFTQNYQTPQTNSKLHDVTGNSEPEIIVEGKDSVFNDRIKLLNLEGEELWEYYILDEGLETEFVENQGLLAWNDHRIVLLEGESGEPIWEHEFETDVSDPEIVKDSIIFSNSSELIYMDFGGEIVRKEALETKIKGKEKFPERELIVGRQDQNLTIVTLTGEKILSQKVEGLSTDFDFASYEQSSGNDLVYSRDDRIEVLGINYSSETETIENPDEFAYVGNTRDILKPAALNLTVFIGEDPEEFRDETDKEIIQVGESLFQRTLDSPNKQLNVSGDRYYVKDRRKSPFVAGLASKNSAAITFDRSSADRDFSNRDLDDIKEEFIETVEPNHIVVSDLESETGLLAGYMASQGIMPLHYQEDYSIPEDDDLSPSFWNEQNRVEKLEERIEKRFQRIGANPETVWNGRHISLIDAPGKIHEDPTTNLNIGESIDGETFISYQSFGDLNGDGFLQAGVGKYPEDVEKASKIYHRSLEKESFENGTIASSYRVNDRWPSVLASMGGGMRIGVSVEKSLETDMDITHLREHRSEPVELMMDLTPGSIREFIDESREFRDLASQFVSESFANLLMYGKVLWETLNFAEEFLMIYYEYPISESELDVSAGLDVFTDSEITGEESDNVQEGIKRTIVEAIYAAIFPEPHSRLEKESLKEELENKDFVYYQGEGEAESWMLPDYNDSNRYQIGMESEDIPQLDNSFVWDGSDLGGVPKSSIRDSIFENGASAYLGHSAKTGLGPSSTVTEGFMTVDNTLGQSTVEASNAARTAASSTKIFGERYIKASKSLNLYGNPETVAPGNNKDYSNSRSCENNQCTLSFDIEPELREISFGNRSTVLFNDTEDLLVPKEPATPYYRYSFDIDSDTVDDIEIDYSYSNETNIKLPEYRPDTELANRNSDNNLTDKFPENYSFYHLKDDELVFFQSAAISYDNKTSILENAEIEVNYRPKASLNLEKSVNTVNANIYSERDFDGQISYKVDGERKLKSVKLEQGYNKLELVHLQEGSTDIEAYLIDDKILDSSSDTFINKNSLTVRNETKKTLKTGEPEDISITLKNENNISINSTVRIETDENSRLDLFESHEKETSIEPNSIKTVDFRIVAESSETSTIAVYGENIENRSLKYQFEERLPVQNILSSSEISKIFKDLEYKTFLSIRNERKAFDIEREQGHLKVRNYPDQTEIELLSDDYYINRKYSTDKSSTEVQADGKHLKKEKEAGEIVYSGNMEKEEFEDYLSQLNYELEKIDGLN